MTFNTELYPHQVAAVEKLIGLRIGALYADMGTGKTRIALEMISIRQTAGKLDRVLWLCPCSVKGNLKTDIEKHCGTVPDFIRIDGIESLSSSDKLYDDLRSARTDKTMLIVDESNLVKNHFALRSKRVTDIAEGCRYRLILNGTPISRNEADLFAQWYLLDWRILGYRSFYSFAANHIEYDPEIKGKVRRVLNTDYLVEKIAPYSYQISLAECVDLPPKRYHETVTHMTEDQCDHYFDITDRMLADIDDRIPETIYSAFSAAQQIISGQRIELGRPYKAEPMFSAKYNPRIITLLDMIQYIDGKAVIFCKYTHEIKDILSVLDSAEAFDGSMTLRQRESAIERFKAGTNYLIANKQCAGYGLNLQFCHNVIYYSNDWDWATRIQSEDRVYRIGQTEPVDIYDIICAGSLDARIIKCLKRKERLEDCIKTELHRSNEVKDAVGSYKKWLKGENTDGKGLY